MNRLFVGNLPHNTGSHSTTEKDLIEFFEGYGVDVAGAQIVRDRMTGHSRGFGFVDTEDAPGPIINKVNGEKMGGRNLTVNIATPKTPKRQFDNGERSRVRLPRHDDIED